MSAGSPQSSAPPPARGQRLSGAALQNHPVWQASKGVRHASSRGRGRGRAAPAEPGAGPRFEPLSLLALEIENAHAPDGADSLLNSDDEQEAPDGQGARAGARSGDGVDYEENSEAEGAAEDDLFDDEDAEDGEGAARGAARGGRKKARGGDLHVDRLASACFGRAAPAGDDGESSQTSEPSQTSSARKKRAFCDAFPVPGVRCVGCAMPSRIAPVDKFVLANAGKMTELCLFKLAALTWQTEVLEPARRGGAELIDWSWREIQTHYKLHCTNDVLGRTGIIQSLTAMRTHLSQNLVRVDESGERSLDKANSELFLKLVAADSRERQLLQVSLSGRGRGAPPRAED